MLAALLRAAGVPAWVPIADQLDAAMDAADSERPGVATAVRPDARTFAPVVISTKLAALSDHAIVELSPDIAADAALVDELTPFIRLGVNRTPSPDGPPPFPARLVPSAAALALRASSAQTNPAGIARRTVDYIHDIPRPEFLAVPPAGRRLFLQGLAERLDVRATAADS